METRNAAALSGLIEKRRRDPDLPCLRCWRSFRRLTQTVLDELTESDEFSRRAYASFLAYKEQAQNYAAITERVFYNEIQPS